MIKDDGVLIEVTNEDIKLLETNPTEFWKGVTSIGSDAFWNCSSLTSITIPEGVTSIGKLAFSNCSSLTSITIPEGVTSIGFEAFQYCSSLTSITIPSSVTSIGFEAFSNCSSLTSITIPEGVTSIGDGAFQDCSSLTSITIPEGVTSIRDEEFKGCSSLTSITIPSSVTSIGVGAFSSCINLTSITIPSSVTKIGNSAFWNCSSLTSVEIPEGVTSIGDDAFKFCSSLTSIAIPEGVTDIGSGSFRDCRSLTSITIPEGVTNIEYGAFAECRSLTEITIPSSVTEIGGEAFYSCENLVEIIIPENVTSIGVKAFDGCSSLTRINIPEGVSLIPSQAFSSCESLTDITIPAGVTEIDDRAFEGCSSLTRINIPEGVTRISNNAFRNCESLTNITIPASITEICERAFARCEKLEGITIPASVTKIGGEAFSNCRGLKSLCIPFSVNSIGDDIVERCDKLENVQVEVAPGKGITLSKDLINMAGNDIITIVKEGKSLDSFNTLCKKIKIDEQNPSYVEFFRMCGVLGLMENKDVTIKKNGKDIPVANISFEILQRMFNQGVIDYDELHASLSNLRDLEFNKPLLEFLTKDKATAIDVFSKMDKFVAVNNWFKARAKLKFTEQVQLEGHDPTIEENRFKVWQNVECEDGVDRVRWYSPTVELILKDIAAHKYEGVTAKTKPIAEILAKYNYDQKHFDKAVEIDEEREKLVAEGKLKNSLTETKVSQSIVEAVEKYKQSTDQMEAEISDNLAECTSTLADDRSKIFTYEMLDKSSEENFVMGNLTSCCARLFGAGAGAQRAMILHPDMQPLVIRDVSGEIIAFSIVYVNREKGYAVLNDIEMNVKYDSKPAAVKRIYEKFEEGVRKFVDTYNAENEVQITQVNCGVSPRGGNAINKYVTANEKAETNLEAVNFDEYKYNGSGSWRGDWFRDQYIIWADDKENLYQR